MIFRKKGKWMAIFFFQGIFGIDALLLVKVLAMRAE